MSLGPRTTSINDTCLQILLAAALGLQSWYLGSSLATHSLCDDRQAGNKQGNKINKTVQQIEDYQQYDGMTR
jgi:hypothetical protein